MVTQQDAVPRQWAYPTNWWEAGEVMSDEIALSLADAPAGRYRIALGVCDPDTLERLPVKTTENTPLGDQLDLEQYTFIP